MGGHKYSIAVDFDGVIHSYTSPWVAPDVICDPPTEGAIEWMGQMLDKFKVYIFSTRCESRDGRVAMRRYLRENGLGDRADEVVFTTGKPACLLYVDDRAWRFEGPGTFPLAEQVHAARPWNRRGR